MHWIHKNRHDHGHLHDSNLYGVYRRHRPRSGLKVSVVDAVKVFEQKLGVKRSMNPVRHVILLKNISNLGSELIIIINALL